MCSRKKRTFCSLKLYSSFFVELFNRYLGFMDLSVESLQNVHSAASSKFVESLFGIEH